MARTNQDGKGIKLVLEFLSHRHLPDTELAAALEIPPTNYYRRRDADDFPTFEELGKFAEYFSLSARALQVAFGYIRLDEILLGEDELRQYLEQGGGKNLPHPHRTTTMRQQTSAMNNGRLRIRQDAPPGA